MSRKGPLPVESLDLQLGLAEIDQQPHVEPGSFEIVDHLSLVLRSQCLHSLDFDQHLSVDDQVGLENANIFATEDHLKAFLFNGLETGLPQRKHQSLLIHALEDLAAKLVDDLEADADDLLRHPFMLHPIPYRVTIRLGIGSSMKSLAFGPRPMS